MIAGFTKESILLFWPAAFVALIIGCQQGMDVRGQSVPVNIRVFPILPCDFEEGTTCQWLQGLDDDFDWTVHSGETPSDFTGPSYDHTKGNVSGTGQYLYTEASDPQQRGYVAHIISPYILPSFIQDCKMTFFYHMFGYHIGALRVFVQTYGSDTMQMVWEQQGQVGDRWGEAQVNLTDYGRTLFQVIIEGEIEGYLGDAAVDDISFSHGCTRVDEGSIRLEDGATPKEGRVEVLYNGTWGTVCNSGWTEQSASVACRQRGYKQAVSSGTRYPGPLSTPIWLSNVVCTEEEDGLADCQRSAWGQTGLCTHSMDVSVECTGFRPPCLEIHNECLNSQCVPMDQWCDFTDDCGDQTDEQQCDTYPDRCDFQHSLCVWIQPDQDDTDWVRHSGSTSTSNTGPTVDHLGSTSSYYLYLEASDSDHRDRAFLANPHTFRPSSSCKVRFYYHMYGRDAGYLRVILTTSEGSQNVWEVSGDQGNNWHRAVAALTSNKNFQIYIEGEVGSSHIGDIGLDDVSLSSGCIIANDSCQTNGGPVFTCGIGGCVPEESRCDFTWNCVDGSDETNCGAVLGRCNFETDLCSWHQNQEDTADFIRARGVDAIGQQLPVEDHTSDSFIGYYVYIINSSPGPAITQTAQLDSRIQLGQSDNCNLRFYYYFLGRSASNISVILRELNTGLRHQLWVKPKVETPVWTFASVVLQGPFTTFTVSLSASLDLTLDGAVAIDDISFSPGCITGNLLTTTPGNTKVATKDKTTFATGIPGFITKPPRPGGIATSPLVWIVIGSLALLVLIGASAGYFARSFLSKKHGSATSQRWFLFSAHHQGHDGRDEREMNSYDQIVQYAAGASQINVTNVGASNMDDQGYATLDLTERTNEYQSLQFNTPSRFICPISKSIMVEPVIASDGYTYDRTEIEGWLIRNQSSPLTKQEITDFELVPNLQLKAEIDEYQATINTRPQTQEKTPPRLTNISV